MALTIQAVVSLDTKMFTAGIRGIEAQVNQFAGLAMMQFGGVAQQISAMWGAFGPAGAAISALSQLTQVGAEYEQQMLRVASYTQASSEEMARLSSAGAEMAASFGFSSQQVGESMSSLALAGVDAADMTDVLQASLLLASATLGDANQSAELVTSTLKVFQQDMGNAKEAADLFAGAIASSPLDLQRLSDSMKYAGATGSSFGMTMEQVVSEIAAFHQVGLRGQMAGTAFRGALLELAAAASQAKGVVGPALEGWRPATEGLTGAVRRLNAAGVDGSIVIQELGKRAGPGVAALMKYGSDAMQDLTEKIRANSDVASMHEKQMDGLKGEYRLLAGEATELAIKISNKLSPGFREVVAQARSAVQWFTDLASKVSGVSGVVNAFIPGVVRLTSTIIGLNAAIKGLNFMGINTGIQSLGGLINKMAESRKASADLAVLQGELNKTETALRNIQTAGSKGFVSNIDTTQLSELKQKADNARVAFNDLQTGGAKPFIQQAAFAAMPRFDELNGRIANTKNLAQELQQSMWKLKLNPDPRAQAEWKSLAGAYDECLKRLEGYRKEYQKLEAAVGKTGLSNYNAALSTSKKNMDAASASAAKFEKSISDKSLKTYTAALEENSKKQKQLNADIKQATAASGGWSMGLNKLQVGVSMLSAAIIGAQIGRFVAQLRVWGTDHTVHEWLTLAIAKTMEWGTTMGDVTGEMSPELEAVKKRIQALRDEGERMANVFIQKMPQSIDYLSDLRRNLADVNAEAKAAANSLKDAFHGISADPEGMQGVLTTLQDMSAETESMKKDLETAFSPEEIKAFRDEVTGLTNEANTLESSLQEKLDAHTKAREEQVRLQTEINKYTEKIRDLEREKLAASSEQKNIYNEAIKTLKSERDELYKLNAQASDALVTAQEELDRENAKLDDLRERVTAAKEKFDGFAPAIANAKEMQDKLNQAFDEWEADQKAEAAAESFDNLADALKNTELSAEDAEAGVKVFGNGLSEVVEYAQNAGIKIEQVGKNLQWMNKDQERASELLERLGIDSQETAMFMVKYGDKCIDVARRMATLGETEEEAAKAVGVLTAAVDSSTKSLKENNKAAAETTKSIMSIAAISPTRMRRLTDNLKELRDALSLPQGQQAPDLSWVRDLGSLSRLPKLSNVDGWLGKFQSLATGIGNVAANMAGVNLDWMAKLKDFSLPNLGGIKEWKSDFSKWAAAVRTELPTLERFADALSSLQGSLSALNDATLKIVFKDESLLSRIESHLSTLASLKGVIWA